jgi:hypothetical protein
VTIVTPLGPSTVTNISSQPSSVQVSFNRDGSIIASGNPSGSLFVDLASNNWCVPTTSGAGDLYQIQADLLGGFNPSTGALGVKQTLDRSRIWTFATPDNYGGGGCVLRFTITAVGAPSVVLATGDFNLICLQM